MILLVDTDIILDVAFKRKDFYHSSASFLNLLEQSPRIGKISWHTVSNVFYLLRPKSGKDHTKQFIAALLKFVEVPETGHKEVRYALSLDMSDFEDALQSAVAKSCNADYIVSRNTKDFKKSPVRAITPESVLKMM